MLMRVANRGRRAIRYQTVLMSTVKLQILLKRKLTGNELDRIEQLLNGFGMVVTGRAPVTLSATMPAERFEKRRNDP